MQQETVFICLGLMHCGQTARVRHSFARLFIADKQGGLGSHCWEAPLGAPESNSDVSVPWPTQAFIDTGRDMGNIQQSVENS